MCAGCPAWRACAIPRCSLRQARMVEWTVHDSKAVNDARKDCGYNSGKTTSSPTLWPKVQADCQAVSAPANSKAIKVNNVPKLAISAAIQSGSPGSLEYFVKNGLRTVRGFVSFHGQCHPPSADERHPQIQAEIFHIAIAERPYLRTCCSTINVRKTATSTRSIASITSSRNCRSNV